LKIDTELKSLGAFNYLLLWLLSSFAFCFFFKAIFFDIINFHSHVSYTRLPACFSSVHLQIAFLSNRLLAYLLPLVKLNTVASDGWLLAGISGWLVLRWAERALGDDHHRLMLLRLHDAVVS
jgi:hypothetical protein